MRLFLREIIVLLLSGFFIIYGFFQIQQSSGISEYIDPESTFYDFELNMEPKEHNFNEFLLSYDFTKKSGTITFLIFFNDPIEYIAIDFPKPINNESVSVKALMCDLPTGFPDRTCRINTDLDYQMHGYDRTLVIKRPPVLSSNYISIDFETDLRPVGTFQVWSNYNNLYESRYTFDLSLGDQFVCPSECYENVRGTQKDATFSQKNLRMEFTDEEVDSYIFRTKGILDNTMIEDKQFKLGVGMSLFTAGIVALALTVVPELFVKMASDRNKPEE